MRFLATTTALLAAATAATAATVATTTLSNMLIGAENVDFVVAISDDAEADLPALAADGEIKLTISQPAWATANPSASAFNCKLSKETKIYSAESKHFISSGVTSVSAVTADSITLGVKVNAAAATAAAGTNLNLLCRVKAPATAVSAVTGVPVTFGAAAGPNTDIPAVVANDSTAAELSRPAATYSVTVTESVNISKKLRDAVVAYFKTTLTAAAADVPTLNLASAASVNQVTFTTPTPVEVASVKPKADGVAADELKTLSFKVRAYPTADSSVGDIDAKASEGSYAALKSVIAAAVGHADSAKITVTKDVAEAVAAHCANGVIDGEGDAKESDLNLGGTDCDSVERGGPCDKGTSCWTGVCDVPEGETVGECVNSASTLVASFGVAAAFVAAAVLGF